MSKTITTGNHAITGPLKIGSMYNITRVTDSFHPSKITSFTSNYVFQYVTFVIK